MKNQVIILGINHESTLGFVRCFGEGAIKPICVLYGSDKGLVFSSKYPSLTHYEKTAEECLAYIESYYSNIDPKPFLFGSNDTSASVINNNYNRLKKHFYLESAKDTEGEIVRLMDKWKLYQEAEKHGLNVAKTILLKKESGVPNDIVYPVFTKSMRTIDGGKRDEMICNNKAELSSFLQSCRSEYIMVQKYIEKKEEFNYYGFACNGCVCLPYENHRPRFSEGALSGYHVFVPAKEDDTYKKVVSIMEETGYSGLFTVEFLRDKNDDLYFMEINFRHDGATFLLTPGINIPIEYCKRVLGEVDGQIQIKKRKIIGIREFVDYYQSVRTGKISIIKWIWDVVTADSHMFWNWKDNGPVRYMIKRRLLKK